MIFVSHVKQNTIKSKTWSICSFRFQYISIMIWNMKYWTNERCLREPLSEECNLMSICKGCSCRDRFCSFCSSSLDSQVKWREKKKQAVLAWSAIINSNQIGIRTETDRRVYASIGLNSECCWCGYFDLCCHKSQSGTICINLPTPQFVAPYIIQFGIWELHLVAPCMFLSTFPLDMRTSIGRSFIFADASVPSLVQGTRGGEWHSIEPMEPSALRGPRGGSKDWLWVHRIWEWLEDISNLRPKEEHSSCSKVVKQIKATYVPKVRHCGASVRVLSARSLRSELEVNWWHAPGIPSMLRRRPWTGTGDKR